MNEYDAGLLNDWGGGNVAWWHDYPRYEIGRANEYWATHMQANESEITRLRAELAAWRSALAKVGPYYIPATNVSDEEAEEVYAAIDAARKGEGE